MLSELKISSIFIANLAEISLNLIKFMKPNEVDEEISEDHALSDRFIFSLKDNSILITPYMINPQFFSDTLALLGLKNVINLSPPSISTSVCEGLLSDSELFKKIVSVINFNPGISLHSYAGTDEFFSLIDKLNSLNLHFTTPEIPQRMNRWTIRFFGSKSGFRQTVSLIAGKFPSLPLGVLSSDQTETIGWAAYFLKKFSGCVLKHNHGLAGAGLKIILNEDIKNSPEEFLKKILSTFSFFHHGPVIIEQFIPPDMSICGGAPNIELQIKNGKINPLYVCSMRVTREGVFQGVEFGRKAVPKKVEKNLRSSGQIFGQTLLSYGYSGFFEIDFVQGSDGKTYPLESNLRRTGGTHAYELALRLLGKNALDESYFVTNNRLLVQQFKNSSYENLKTQVSELFYPINGQKRGLILTIISNLSRGRLGYVVIGKDKKDALEIEQRLLKKLLVSPSDFV